MTFYGSRGLPGQTDGPPALVNAIRHKDTVVLFAVLNGSRTYGRLMAVTGLNRNALHDALKRLRNAELVTWENKRRGTLRPCVTRVPFGDGRVIGTTRRRGDHDDVDPLRPTGPAALASPNRNVPG